MIGEIKRNAGRPTAKTCRAVVSGMMQLAVRYGALSVNPVREVEAIESRPKSPPGALTNEEIIGLRQQLTADEATVRADLPDLVVFMLGTGVRIGESLAVLGSQVDLDAGTVEITHTIARLPGQGLVRKAPKSKAGERALPLPDWAVAMLRRRHAAGIRLDEPIFADSLEGFRDPSNVRRALRRALSPVGSTARRDLGKTLRSARLQAGLTRKQVVKTLGWPKTRLELIENGRIKLDRPLVATLVKTYGIDLDSSPTLDELDRLIEIATERVHRYLLVRRRLIQHRIEWATHACGTARYFKRPLESSVLSWVLVAWDGPVPTSTDDAARIFEEPESSVSEDDPPTDAIRGNIEELLARWPDITQDGGEDSPRADVPLIANAAGPLFIFSLGVSSLTESIPCCTEVARRRGIVLYDQEQDEVYAPAAIPTAAAAPTPHHRPDGGSSVAGESSPARLPDRPHGQGQIRKSGSMPSSGGCSRSARISRPMEEGCRCPRTARGGWKPMICSRRGRSTAGQTARSRPFRSRRSASWQFRQVGLWPAILASTCAGTTVRYCWPRWRLGRTR